MKSPLVSIVIVNWNGERYIDECITSLLNQTYSNFEIILVDNASTDDSVEFVKEKFPMVQIIQNESNLGFAKAVNIGIGKARGGLIALFNQDAIADKEWLTRLVDEINKSNTTAAVAGKVYYWGDKYGKNAVFCTWSKVDPYTACPYNFNGDEPRAKVDYLTGCAMLVKREVINSIGLLDEGYFLYFDETDWCARMIRAGYDLAYVPEAIAWHVVSGSSGAETHLYYMTRSRIRFALKNFDLLYLPSFLLFYILESILVFLRGVRKFNLLETKIRLKAIRWNIFNLRSTFKARKRDLSKIKNIRSYRSYNRSLPLRRHEVGRLEQYLKFIGK